MNKRIVILTLGVLFALVFERIYRTDHAHSSRTGGRILGLAIMHQIISQHGGHGWGESQPGHGSSFGYNLPVQ